MTEGRKREQITPHRERQVLEIIATWDPQKSELNASALARKVICRLVFETTRQGLMKRPEIKKAFDARILELYGPKPAKAPEDPLEVQLQRRIEKLVTQLAERDAQITAYKELFARHHFNALSFGKTIAELEAPIPSRNNVAEDGEVKRFAKRGRRKAE